jgi:amidophosphoribosyltransferase
MCGIIGVYGNDEAATLAYLGLYAQQHRGQEGAGIVTLDNGKINRVMGEGLVADVYAEPDVLSDLKGNMAIGHTRYSTTGGMDQKNVGPMLFNIQDQPVSVAHNGNLVDIQSIRQELQAEGALFQTTTDSEIIIHLMARAKGKRLVDRLIKALDQVKGAYSLLLLTPEGLIAARDPHGWHPFALGKMGDTWVLASETCAFDLIGAEETRIVQPGEVLLINDEGLQVIKQEENQSSHHCIFEYIYFSRPDSRIFGANVDKLRRRLGNTLATEAPVPTADIVISVPDSSNTATIGYSLGSGVKHEIGLIRNHYVGRSFIRPEQKLRDLTVKLKFNTVKGVLEDKEVIIVDDSIVRGTTMKKLVRLVRAAGAKAVHVRVSSPPIRYSCHFGMDFPTRDELIANQRELDEIRDYLGADSVAYLSLDGLLESMDLPANEFCTACFSGNYPVKLEQENRKDLFEQ